MNPVTVIGGVNVDINCFSHDPINMADSNPGRVEYCPGGVGRNIAENLCRLGLPVRLVSVIGDDPGGSLIRTSSREAGLDISRSFFLHGTTPVYTAIMDSNGEMKLALADMSLLDEMTASHLESRAEIIRESAIVVLDANLSGEIIRFVLDRFGSSGQNGGEKGGKPLFFLDPVSARKAVRAVPLIGGFHTVKAGRMEAAALSGVDIPLPANPVTARADGQPAFKAPFLDALEEAAGRILAKGTERVFITLGKEGVFCARKSRSFLSPVPQVKPVNTSGGGDAFMAGAVYGTLLGLNDEDVVSFASAMAALTVMSANTVMPAMNVDLVQKTIKAHT